MNAAGDWLGARNVLCIRLDNLGDVLMTVPAIRALRHGRADRRITLLASPGAADVASMVPEIDATIAYEAPWMKASTNDDHLHDLAMRETLAAGHFDAAVIFTVYSQSPLPAAMLCRLAGIPLCLAHCRENPYRLLSDWIRETEPAQWVRHEVERQLDLVVPLGASRAPSPPHLNVPAEARERVEKRLRSHGVASDEHLVVVHPGASAPSRRYPVGRFAAAVEDLVARRKCRVVVTGSAAEADIVDALCEDVSQPALVWGWAGTMDVREFAALIERADLLISNNTGPVHIASSLGTPVVDLYALTNPQHGPWSVPHRTLFHDVPCRFCYRSVCPEGHHRCLLGVSAEEVVAAACELLDGTPAMPAPSPARPAIAGSVVGWHDLRQEAA